ncbi:MAG: Gfo/Idh/MocA family protein, partial [Opitutaceae bacterium]
PVVPRIQNLDATCDAVILATPNSLHPTGAIEAAAARKHVLTEKVLGITREAMDRMIAACRDAGVKLAVSYQRRASPDNLAVKRVLENGSLGRVLAADMEVKFFRDAAYYRSGAYRGTWATDGGGAFMQQAAHNADILCWFFGLPDKVVSMLGRRVHAIETEDHGAALLHYPDGMIATFTASTICKPGFAARFSIYAEAGSLVLENDRITEWKIDGVENPASKGFEVHDGATSATVADTAGHEAILRDFIEAVRDNREPLVSGVSARDATELILRIYENNITPLPATTTAAPAATPKRA